MENGNVPSFLFSYDLLSCIPIHLGIWVYLCFLPHFAGFDDFMGIFQKENVMIETEVVNQRIYMLFKKFFIDCVIEFFDYSNQRLYLFLNPL